MRIGSITFCGMFNNFKRFHAYDVNTWTFLINVSKELWIIESCRSHFTFIEWFHHSSTFLLKFLNERTYILLLAKFSICLWFFKQIQQIMIAIFELLLEIGNTHTQFLRRRCKLFFLDLFKCGIDTVSPFEIKVTVIIHGLSECFDF